MKFVDYLHVIINKLEIFLNLYLFCCGLNNSLKTMSSSKESSLTKSALSKRTHSESTENEDLSNLNKMHPRNRYKDNPPDFSVLAFKYSSFYPL